MLLTQVSSVLILSLLTCCQGKDYCRKDLCPKGITHIACNNTGKFGSQCTKDAVLMKIEKCDRNTLIKEHNLVRQKWASGKGNVTRTACKMPTMGWDQDLAYLASLNARSCVMEHDNCHNTAKYPESGQNLFRWTTRDMKLLSVTKVFRMAVAFWAEEEAHITAGDLEKISTNSSKVFHLTAMLNEKNTKVGCAMVTNTKDGYRYYYVACDYPVNNMLDQSTYTQCDQPGSGCTKGLSSNYTPLCA